MDFERYMLKKLRENRKLNEAAGNLDKDFKPMTYDDSVGGWIGSSGLDYEFERFEDGSAPVEAIAGTVKMKDHGGNLVSTSFYCAYGMYQDDNELTPMFILHMRSSSFKYGFSVTNASDLTVTNIYRQIKALCAENNPRYVLKYIRNNPEFDKFDFIYNVNLQDTLDDYVADNAPKSMDDLSEKEFDEIIAHSQEIFRNAVKELQQWAVAQLDFETSEDLAAQLIAMHGPNQKI